MKPEIIAGIIIVIGFSFYFLDILHKITMLASIKKADVVVKPDEVLVMQTIKFSELQPHVQESIKNAPYVIGFQFFGKALYIHQGTPYYEGKLVIMDIAIEELREE